MDPYSPPKARLVETQERSRSVGVAIWVASALLCLVYNMNGGRELEGVRSDGFTQFIGACELLGGIALLIPPLAFWSACGLIVIMIGAVLMQLTHQTEAAPLFVSGAMIVMLTLIARVRRKQALFLS